MYLALRQGAASDATWLDKFFVWVIKERLVTVFPHAGIVIGNTLYHATARHGFCRAEYTPHRWTLLPLGDERDTEVQALAEDLIALGTGYDFAELLDFTPLHLVVRAARLVPALRRRLDNLLYCYQWCWLAMTGSVPTSRVTAEMLQSLYIKQIAGRLKGVAL